MKSYETHHTKKTRCHTFTKKNKHKLIFAKNHPKKKTCDEVSYVFFT